MPRRLAIRRIFYAADDSFSNITNTIPVNSLPFPVPEPTTAALLDLGLVSEADLAWRAGGLA